MKIACFFGAVLATAIPAMASAQDVMQPKFPPSFDCASVPAGSERDDCRRSRLSPDDMTKGQTPTDGALQTPGTISPPTVPDEPGNENRDSGPGTAGTPGGIGN